MNVLKLKGKIAEMGQTQESVAAAIGIDRTTFSRKITGGGGGFSIREASEIAGFLGLTQQEAATIFLDKKSRIRYDSSGKETI